MSKSRTSLEFVSSFFYAEPFVFEQQVLFWFGILSLTSDIPHGGTRGQNLVLY